MSPKLPERVDKEHRIIPSILSGTISSTAGFHMNILPDSRVKGWIMHDPRIRNERHGKVRMIMGVDDGSGWDLFLGLHFCQHRPGSLGNWMYLFRLVHSS